MPLILSVLLGVSEGEHTKLGHDYVKCVSEGEYVDHHNRLTELASVRFSYQVNQVRQQYNWDRMSLVSPSGEVIKCLCFR